MPYHASLRYPIPSHPISSRLILSYLSHLIQIVCNSVVALISATHSFPQPHPLPLSLASGRYSVRERESEDESITTPTQRLPRRCALSRRHRLGRSPHMFVRGGSAGDTDAI